MTLGLSLDNHMIFQDGGLVTAFFNSLLSFTIFFLSSLDNSLLFGGKKGKSKKILSAKFLFNRETLSFNIHDELERS